jgi:glycogen debranching enzyme
MLGLNDDASRWTELEEQTIQLMVSKLWGPDGFSPRGSINNEQLRGASTSQVDFLPLLLGDALPDDVRESLVERFLSSGLLTAHGVASESPDSPSYEPDGYWRGPIWAPTTLLIADGLARCGRPDLTEVIAQGFLANCDINGFAENYDAVTGRGLRDRAYSWSASVYSVFSEQSEIFREPPGSRT